MKGSFSEDALEQFARLAAEKQGLDFSEGEVYDFARCVRPDGSFYGTGGTCRKGSDAGDKKPEAPKKTSKGAGSEAASNGDSRANLVKAHAVFAAAKAKEEEARKGQYQTTNA